MRELFKKYQIEVVQPNLDFIINTFESAFEKVSMREEPSIT